MEDEKNFLNRKRKVTEEHNSNISSNETDKKSNKLVKSNKKPNRKRLLKNKLEFFLSDINLYHDKYLRDIYISNKGNISPETFLSFNSIKALLSDIEKTENKKNVIIKAVEISNKIKYDKVINKIKRVIPYDEKSLNIELYDKCTIYFENFPSIIRHENIYDLFKDYQILYISLLKEKNNKLSGKAFITFKNENDIPIIINKYNNMVPKVISSLNPKELKPLQLMTLAEYNKIKENNKIIKEEKKIQINKKENNIDENTCIKITDLKSGIKLSDIQKCLSEIKMPLFIDINRDEKNAILRFASKEESNDFLEKIKNDKYEKLKDIVNYQEGISCVEELDDIKLKNYLDYVKQEISNFKEKKEKKKMEKIKKLSDKKDKENKEIKNIEK